MSRILFKFLFNYKYLRTGNVYSVQVATANSCISIYFSYNQHISNKIMVTCTPTSKTVYTGRVTIKNELFPFDKIIHLQMKNTTLFIFYISERILSLKVKKQNSMMIKISAEAIAFIAPFPWIRHCIDTHDSYIKKIKCLLKYKNTRAGTAPIIFQYCHASILHNWSAVLANLHYYSTWKR